MSSDTAVILPGYADLWTGGVRLSRRPEVRDTTVRRRSMARFAVVVAGLLIVGVAGYIGFVAFVESDRSTGTFVLAASTGFAAFFSPCSFPLLLTFLTRRADESVRSASTSALRVGVGAVSLLLVLAIPLAVFGDVVGTVVAFDRPVGRFFRATVGLALIVLGLRQARVLRVRMRGFDRLATWAASAFDPSRVASRRRSDFVYGFGYLLAGFG